MNKEWPAERLTFAKRLWDGGHSASEIARELGVSRNAVMGQAHRRKWGKRRAPTGGREKRLKEGGVKKRINPFWPLGPRAKKQSAVPLPPMPVKIPPKPPTREPVPLMQIIAGMCRFPVNDPPPRGEFLFCGAPVMPGKVYCPFHCGIAYRLVEIKEAA